MASDIDPILGPTAEVTERRRRQAERWRARSARVRQWRRLLPIAIVGAVALLGLWIGGRGLIAKITEPRTTQGGAVRMVNPRFYGRDTNNRAFVVAAASAERGSAGSRTITLKGPALTLDADGANPTQVQAASGVYREQQRTVRLDGGVRMHDGRGYSFSTPRAVIDTQAGRVSGDQGVRGRGPLGQISASSYGVYDRGERIVLKGGVRARIEQ